MAQAGHENDEGVTGAQSQPEPYRMPENRRRQMHVCAQLGERRLDRRYKAFDVDAGKRLFRGFLLGQHDRQLGEARADPAKTRAGHARGAQQTRIGQ